MIREQRKAKTVATENIRGMLQPSKTTSTRKLKMNNGIDQSKKTKSRVGEKSKKSASRRSSRPIKETKKIKTSISVNEPSENKVKPRRSTKRQPSRGVAKAVEEKTNKKNRNKQTGLSLGAPWTEGNTPLNVRHVRRVLGRSTGCLLSPELEAIKKLEQDGGEGSHVEKEQKGKETKQSTPWVTGKQTQKKTRHEKTKK